jgi:hypothetical protein
MQDNIVLIFSVLFFSALWVLCFDDGMFSGFVVIVPKFFGDGKCLSFSRIVVCY